MAYTFDPSTQEEEADRSLWIQGQTGLQSEFQDSQGCVVRPVSKKKKKKKKKKIEREKEI